MCDLVRLHTPIAGFAGHPIGGFESPPDSRGVAFARRPGIGLDRRARVIGHLGAAIQRFGRGFLRRRFGRSAFGVAVWLRLRWVSGCSDLSVADFLRFLNNTFDLIGFSVSYQFSRSVSIELVVS